MIRILITPLIVEMAKEYARNLFADRDNKFEQPLDLLDDFERKLRKRRADKYADYVKMIIQKYPIINAIQPQYYESLHKKYFNTLDKEELSKTFRFKKKIKPFHEIIVSLMRYQAARKKDLLPYIKELGIKTCVYCNTQLAATVED